MRYVAYNIFFQISSNTLSLSYRLLTRDGEPLGIVPAATGKDAKKVLGYKHAGAISIETWSLYETQFGTAQSPMEELLVECEEGRVLIRRVCNYFLCFISAVKHDLPSELSRVDEFGLLKRKAAALAALLETPLAQLENPALANISSSSSAKVDDKISDSNGSV